MSAPPLAAADPVAAMLAWLRAHPAVLAEFGEAARISGRNESPYPRLAVSPSAGGHDGDLLWLITPEIELVTYAALDGTPGQAALRRMHYTALQAAAEVVAAAPTGQPVISAVRPSSAARYRAEPLSGQPAWRSTLLITVHPPLST